MPHDLLDQTTHNPYHNLTNYTTEKEHAQNHQASNKPLNKYILINDPRTIAKLFLPSPTLKLKNLLARFLSLRSCFLCFYLNHSVIDI
jgi:hypothetical protein